MLQEVEFVLFYEALTLCGLQIVTKLGEKVGPLKKSLSRVGGGEWEKRLGIIRCKWKNEELP